MTPHADAGVLLRWTAWADDRIYAQLAELPVATLAAPTPIFAGSILRTLNHVCLIGKVWRAHLLGIPHGFTTRNPETTAALAELHAAQRELDRWFIDCAETTTPATADDSVAFTFIGGGEGRMTRTEILLHVAAHASYHRGHLTAMLYLAGLQPPATDLPVFLRDARQANNSRCAS